MPNVRPIAELREHPDCGLVPGMREGEYQDLLADVRQRGIVTPLEVTGDVTLDGRHRLRAAKEIGLAELPVREVELPADDPGGRSYMLKAAVLRRHLTDDQRAMIAALWAKTNSKPRGGDRKSDAAKDNAIKSPHVGGFDSGKHVPPAQADAAALMNVSPKKVEVAAAVHKADPDLTAKIHNGEIKLSRAARQVQAKKGAAKAPGRARGRTNGHQASKLDALVTKKWGPIDKAARLALAHAGSVAEAEVVRGAAVRCREHAQALVAEAERVIPRLQDREKSSKESVPPSPAVQAAVPATA